MMTQETELLLGEVAAYVESAQGMMARGEWVDLAGLDKEVERLCLAITALLPEQAVEYAPELEYLHEQISALEADMRQKRDAIKQEIQDTKVHERANKAYVQGTTLTPKSES